MAEVTVIGGGIAGLTAAITAAEEGCRVHLLEERAELGGRARTAPPPYRANLGTHALYTNGPFWEWLVEHRLLPATVPRNGRLQYRVGGKTYERLPSLEQSIATIVSESAPDHLSFRDWARTLVGSEAAEELIGFAFIPTFDADSGRLSAAFVHERIRRVIEPDVVRYVVEGWQALVAALSERAEQLGVAIETRHKVTVLPESPVVVATGPGASHRLLGGHPIHAEPRVALLDLAVAGEIPLPSSLLDVDERLYLARYTAFDRSLAPDSEELIQIDCGCFPGERLAETQARIERVLDSIAPMWRRRLRWSRRSLLSGATGAVDLPGRNWRDRPRVSHREGVYRAGDYVAAPGFFSEVSFASGCEAGHAAAAFLLQGTAFSGSGSRIAG